MEPLTVDVATLDRFSLTTGFAVTGCDTRFLQVGECKVLVAEPSMLRLYASVERIARTSLPVLICGETGTGKELVAEAIRVFGPRSLKPMVRINAAAIPSNLLESELFGHERGAFTGAVKSRPGVFEEAAGGTLFLDEIGELPLPLQAKLLRVLEDGRIRRIGSIKERQVDVRVVVATNRDLQSMIRAGTFREDFYHRISTLHIDVPPLRERRAEISPFAEHFAHELCWTMGRVDVSFDPETISALQHYRWPGNVRELRNVVADSLVLCGAVISGSDLPTHVRSTQLGRGGEPGQCRSSRPASYSLKAELREIERHRILKELRACHGNQTEAAKALQMPRRTFIWKLAALKI